MTTAPEIQTAPPPSLGRLIKTTVLAVIAAAILLVLFVLPAEYGIDPLGTGRRLGLTDIAIGGASEPIAAPSAGALQVPTQKGPIRRVPARLQVRCLRVRPPAVQYIEYKYQLEKGATMIYAWTASADVSHDFHAERAGGASSEGPAEQSFEKNTRRQDTGSYTAPFTGIHGWYWENPGGEPITIKLSSAGFYTSAVEIHSNRTRHPHSLRPLDQLPALRQPASRMASEKRNRGNIATTQVPKCGLSRCRRSQEARMRLLKIITAIAVSACCLVSTVRAHDAYGSSVRSSKWTRSGGSSRCRAVKSGTARREITSATSH